jgi:hypothetical protein
MIAKILQEFEEGKEYNGTTPDDKECKERV